jgi:hypothetical protein
LRVTLRRGHPCSRQEATEPERGWTTQIHKGNCGGDAVIDKRKYVGVQTALLDQCRSRNR